MMIYETSNNYILFNCFSKCTEGLNLHMLNFYFKFRSSLLRTVINLYLFVFHIKMVLKKIYENYVYLLWYLYFDTTYLFDVRLENVQSK